MRVLCKGILTAFSSRTVVSAVRRLTAIQNELKVFLGSTCLRKLQQKRGFASEGQDLLDLELRQAISEFQENGVVCIRKLFNESWQRIAHQGIERNFSNPSIYGDWLVGENGDGVYFNDYMNWNKIPEFEKFVLHSPAAKIAGLLMQSEVCHSFPVGFSRKFFLNDLGCTIDFYRIINCLT